jgi:proteic killer suppression protein
MCVAGKLYEAPGVVVYKIHAIRESVIDSITKKGYYQKCMDVLFRDDAYSRLESDPTFTGGHSAAIVKAYRNRMNFIRQAPDERDLYAWKSLRFEKLQGNRNHQHSLRLNDQWRLIIEFDGVAPNKKIVIVGIEDYH